MTDVQQKMAAQQFAKNWTGHGDEKQETQRFWIDLLQNVFGVEQATNAIEFEVRVKLDHTSFIDGYIDATHVLIEQKSLDKDLRRAHQQNDRAVMEAYGFPTSDDFTESDCVARLFEMYKTLTQ